MKRFYDFIKSPQAPVFALATMIMTFFQMYAKLYYHHNPYRLNQVLDVLIALIAALGLSTITFIIIVHSKKRWMPVFFASMDFIGGLLFYGKDLMEYYQTGAYIDIGSVLFIPGFKASAIYFVGEIFLEEVTSKRKNELMHKEEELEGTQKQLEKQENISTSLEQQLEEAKQQLGQQLENTQQELEQLKTQSKEWKEKSYKYDISNLKRSLYHTNNQTKKKQKQQELEKLEDMLSNIHQNGKAIIAE